MPSNVLGDVENTQKALLVGKRRLTHETKEELAQNGIFGSGVELVV